MPFTAKDAFVVRELWQLIKAGLILGMTQTSPDTFSICHDTGNQELVELSAGTNVLALMPDHKGDLKLCLQPKETFHFGKSCVG